MIREVSRWLMLISVVCLATEGLTQTAQNTRDTDHGDQVYVNTVAARAATEKVLAQMASDFVAGGPGLVQSNFGSYSNLIPGVQDDPYWGGYTFLNPQTGAAGSVNLTTQYSNSFVTITNGELQGMSAYETLYQIQSNARRTNDVGTNLIGGVELDVAFDTVPLFEFGIFYNSLLEFTTAGTLAVQGPVHVNSDIYTGSANTLTFSYPVTTTGVVTNPAWAGQMQTNYTGAVIYNGAPAPGFQLSQPPIYLPIGTSNNLPTNMDQILYPAQPGDSPAMKQQRFWNKAEMLILVSNTTYYATDNIVIVKLQAGTNGSMSYQDPSPVWFTNISATGSTNNNWKTNNFDYWLSTTNTMYDYRQQQYMRLTQINVSNFTIWCSTNNFIYSNVFGTNKFSASAPLNIVYVADGRATNGTTNTAVRLKGGGSTNFPPYGFTVATPDPLYVWGNYNAPSVTNYNSTNVTGTVPASFICDALTVLSPNWIDGYTVGSSASARPATSMTVNAAIVAGAVYSTGPGGTGTTQYSGGVHNLIRLLENWGNGSTLTLNTSFVNLFPSAVATTPFIWPTAGTVYGVPATRQYYFNQNFRSLAGMPPGTPMVVVSQRVGERVLNAAGAGN